MNEKYFEAYNFLIMMTNDYIKELGKDTSLAVALSAMARTHLNTIQKALEVASQDEEQPTDGEEE